MKFHIFATCIFAFLEVIFCDFILQLDKEKEFFCAWNYNENFIWFELSIKSFGYIVFGYSKEPTMRKADIIVAWVDNNTVHFKDRYMINEFTPIEDDFQDYEYSGFVNGTHTVIKFKRQIKTCDPLDLELTEDTIYLIWAFHQNKPENEDSLMFYGLKKGSSPVYLFHHFPHFQSEKGSNFFTIDLKTNMSKIFNSYFYVAKMITLPHFKEQKFVTQWISHIQYEYIKHVILYACPHQISKAKVDGKVHANFQPSTPRAFFECTQIVCVWTRGSLDIFTYPNNTGFSMGMKKDPSVVLLEVLYDEEKLKGKYPNEKIDPSKDISSVVSITAIVTNKKIKHRAGVLAIGVEPVDWMIIPKKQSSFIHKGHCHSSCLKQGLSKNRISVFASHFYTNEYVTSFVSRHFRNHEELKHIEEDNNVREDFHRAKFLPKYIYIEKNDYIITHCNFNTLKSKFNNIHGLWSKQEKCLQFLHYFPKMDDLNTCRSHTSFKKIGKLFDVKDLNTSIFDSNLPKRFWVDKDRKTLAHFLYLTNWYKNKNLTRKLQTIYKSKTTVSVCTSNHFSFVSDKSIPFDISSINTYAATKRPCITVKDNHKNYHKSRRILNRKNKNVYLHNFPYSKSINSKHSNSSTISKDDIDLFIRIITNEANERGAPSVFLFALILLIISS